MLRIISALAIFFMAGSMSGGDAQDRDRFQYNAHGKRDPFVSLFVRGKDTALGLDEVRSINEIRVEGIAHGARGEPAAILNGEIVRENKKIGNVEVKKITNKTVKLLINGMEYTVELRKGE